ncbi:MAG: class I SAM-dependent methyltransferase [Bacteroidetes bacterium]|nr:class I SAM-dependent methyltransferase [Bacteroidota bacterium]
MKNKLDTYVKAYEGDIQYDFDNEILLNWYPKRILNDTIGAKSLLELGLGHGYSTNIFSKQFSKHIVLEGSPAVIVNFRKKYPSCECQIVETYFESFTSNEKFDVIVMGFILEHVDDPKQILMHFKKFLNPGGKLFVAVPNAEVLNRRLGYIAGLLPDIQQLSENDFVLGHKRYYTVSSLSEQAKESGYKIVKVEGIYLKPITTSQMISLNFDKKIIDAFCVVGVNYPELSCGILMQLTNHK